MEIFACERNYKWPDYVFLKQNFICTDFEKENLATGGEVEHNFVLNLCFCCHACTKDTAQLLLGFLNQDTGISTSGSKM